MRSILLTCVLATTVATAPAHASCAGFTDPSGDVAVASGVTVPDGHVDLRTVAFRPTATALVVTITDTALNPKRLGKWTVTFTSGRTKLYVLAGLGVWANVGTVHAPTGFRAGVVGRADNDVTGAFDYPNNTITVTAPYRAFGGALPRGAVTVTDVTVDAEEMFVHAATEAVTFSDTVHAARVAVARC